MPPKATKNSFADLKFASEAGRSGSRENKKIQRAIEHRQRKSEERRSHRHSGHSAAPFFTLAIEANNTAVALDARGHELVSVKFDDYDDLVSESFREYITQAVMAAVEQREQASTVEVIEISSSSRSSSEDDMTSSTSTEIEDIDVLFESALGGLSEEPSRELATSSIYGGDLDTTLDADLALALRLQEEEEEAATQAAVVAKKRVGGAWASTFYKSQPSITSVLGTAPGVKLPTGYNVNATTRANDDFPALGMASSLRPSGEPSSSSNGTGQRVPVYTQMAASRSKGVRLLNKPSSSRSNSIDLDVPSTNQFHSAMHVHSELEALGYRKVNDDLADPSGFLNSYDKNAIKARADALKWMEQAAEKDARNENRMARDYNRNVVNNSSTGPSSEAIRRMMDSCKSIDTAEGILSELPGAENDEEGSMTAIERSDYCRKSIRKLVNDMIGAGWRPLVGRGGGHYVYERLVGPNCVKQLLVLPSTPSDRRSTQAVHARLQKMDREAAEIKARAGVV